MDAATPRPQPAFPAAVSSRKKGPLGPLRIDTPQQAHSIVLASPETSTCASALSSATSDTESFNFPPTTKPRSKNMKKLSLALPSAQSSTNSLLSPLAAEPPTRIADAVPTRRRRPSIISLPNASTSSILHRKDEDGDGEDSSAVPYADGPVQILPGIWLGNEDNARDWRCLVSRGIKAILNVAKEVTCPLDGTSTPALRSSVSTPNFKNPVGSAHASPSTYFPPHAPSGRPGMHYLQMPWSHGQSDLVSEGFPYAMAFVDQALERGDGVLIHCQCGVSRSATLVIALVMRAAAQCSPRVPSEVWALKGMQGAYSYVKEKSKCVGPNMSLIYQLLDYERAFQPNRSPSMSDQSSMMSEEEEWARRRQSLDDADTEDNDRESMEVMREAQALDKAMEHRRISRKSSVSSTGSSTGLGMGQAWRNKYGSGRKRAGSIASIITTGSILSEHLVEEDEEQDLLGVGGGFTEPSCSSAEPTEDEASTNNPFLDETQGTSDFLSGTPKAQRRTSSYVPPSAPAHKSSFELPAVPATAIATSFNLSKPRSKPKRRPPPLFGLLPPVPPSPVTPVSDIRQISRSRSETHKLELRIPSFSSSRQPSKKAHQHIPPPSATPAQTLFVFPPSPTLSCTTPCTLLTLTSNSLAVPPSATTPRASNMRSKGRPRSFLGLGAPATPTTASSRVDARGWFGLH